MAKISCKMCGGSLELPEGITYAECPYCGTAATFPKISDDHKESLYNRAEDLRRANEFDKALQAYEKILEIDDSDPEIYWGMVLCRYGIEYVEDPVSHQRIPTCHRVQFESILQDSDYRSALEHASGNESAYEAEARKIAGIQKQILAISASEEPFDIFICYKEASDAGSRTIDSTIAQDIYYQLTNEGYRVFFARITLEDKLGQEYEPYIFAALNSAKVMLVIGSKKEYFDAPWVRNEWSRFLSIMKKDRSRLLIPCYKEMDAYDIPEELSMFQSQDMSKIGFVQDLLRGIKKISVPEAQTKNGNSGNSDSDKIQKLLKRAQVEKELDNLAAVYDIGVEITEIDVDNVEGWFLQACSCAEAEHSIKLFEKIIRMKPDCAEFYIAAAKELSLFAEDAEDHFDALLDARDAYDDFIDDQGDVCEDDIIEGPEWNEFNECFDACDADVRTLEFCIAKLSCLIDNKVPGVQFSQNDKAEAKKQAVNILDQLIDLKTQLRDEEIYCMILDEKEEKKELDSLAELILMRSIYSSEKLTSEVFFNAVATGNLTTVRKFINDGGDINITNENGDTPLALAVLAGVDDIVRLLIQNEGEVNLPSGVKKYSPLHVMFFREKGDNPEIVKMLLENGADPNAVCADGNTPLSLAFALKEIKISATSLIYLLRAGADPEHLAGNYYTPLLRAVQEPDKFELVKILLENGANYNVVAKTSGGTPMDYAKGEANISLLKQVGCQKALNDDPIPKDRAIAGKQMMEKIKKSTPIQVIDIVLGSYDASDGVDEILPLEDMSGDDLAAWALAAEITIANRSNKVIKYVDLDLQAVNRVDDLISKITSVPLTGPIAPGATVVFRIDPLDFEVDMDNDEEMVDCSNIADVDICGAEVEFMDGEIVEVSGEAMTLEMGSVPPPPQKQNISESVNTYNGADFAHAVRWLSIIIAIGGIIAIFTSFTGKTINASSFFGGIIAFVFAGAIWHILKRPCPRCKRDNALEVIDSDEISHTPAYLKKDSYNKLGVFYKVRKNVTYQCRFCGYVEQCEETDEEQLN